MQQGAGVDKCGLWPVHADGDAWSGEDLSMNACSSQRAYHAANSCHNFFVRCCSKFPVCANPHSVVTFFRVLCTEGKVTDKVIPLGSEKNYLPAFLSYSWVNQLWEAWLPGSPVASKVAWQKKAAKRRAWAETLSIIQLKTTIIDAILEAPRKHWLTFRWCRMCCS